MYSNFEFYKSEYGGSKIKSEADFKRLSGKACSYIDVQTMGRIKASELSPDVLEKVKLCECELSESFALSERSAGLVSESNDGYSVTFAVDGSGKSAESVRSREIIVRFLWETGFLYRGIG